ncbi:MAG: universal stress protein [Chloroflexi bacterium]|nr:MAG: universal stress protein [Chloroflexota bacterium]
MFQRILVPLDGSARAERALPVAARLARASGGSIVLLRAVTSPIDFAWYAMESPIAMQEGIEADIARATDYLASVAGSPELAGIEIKTEVLPGAPALSIFPVARAFQADLIVMCSHGYTGRTRWILGSVSQKVVQHSPVPVLVLREDGSVPVNLHPDGMRPVRVLVPLDGSSFAESALAPAAHLSAALSAPAQGALHLAQVLRLPTLYEYGQNDQLAEMKKQGIREAQAYLSTVERKLREGDLAELNLSVTSSVSFDSDVAGRLIGIAEVGEDMQEVEEYPPCDLIAMATHGRGGLQRWMLGSVTERVLDSTKLPLLIVRPNETIAQSYVTTEGVLVEVGLD